MIEIVNMKNCKDFGKDGDVRIDRASPFGNPFPIGTCVIDDKVVTFTRDGCIDRYEQFVRNGEIVIVNDKKYDGIRTRLAIKNLALRPDVKRLACWCAPLRCHGEVILKLLEEYKEE